MPAVGCEPVRLLWLMSAALVHALNVSSYTAYRLTPDWLCGVQELD